MTKQQGQWLLILSLLSFGLIVAAHYLVDFSVAEYIYATFSSNTSLIHFARTWSYLGLGWPYLVVLATLFLFARFILSHQKMAAYAAYLWLCVAISGAVCDVLKEIFGRPRPMLYFGHHLSHFIFLAHRQFNLNDYTSFPSGHATTAASFAVGIMLLFPRLRSVAILFAVSIMVARVLLLKHYVADVMAGLYLGSVTSVLVYFYKPAFFFQIRPTQSESLTN